MQQVDSPLPASSQPPARTSKPPSPVATGLLFAFVTALLAFQPLTRLAVLKLFADKDGQLIQEAIPPGFPVPKALAWSAFSRSLVTSSGTMTSATVLVIGIFLSCILVYALLRILNPTFRITTGVDWHESVLFKTYMHTSPLIKAFLIAVCAALPLFIVWQLVRIWAGESPFGLWFQLAVAGVAAFALFSRAGVAGDYESLTYQFPRDRAIWTSLAVRGILAGTAVWAAWQYEPTYGPDMLFSYFRSLGGIGESHFWQIVAIRCSMAGLLAFGLGGLLNVIGMPGRSATGVLRAAVIPAAVFVFMLYFGRAGFPQYLRNSHDFDPDSKAPQDATLVRAAGLSAPAADGQQVLLIGPRGSNAMHFDLKSVVGAPADEKAVQQLYGFVQRRGYATALSYVAFVTLYDASALAFDPEECLRALVINLTHCPDSGALRLLIQRLDNIAPTPAVIQAVTHAIGDETLLFPDRQSCVYAGDVWARLGQKDQARMWYRRAYMPPGQIDDHYEQATRFTLGKVSGKLELDGKPLAGIRVGVIPVQSLRLIPRLTDPATGRVSPFWLWQVTAAAVTNSQGEFRLDDLIGGRYILAIRMPGRRNAQSGPAPFIDVASDLPEVKLGTISLREAKPASATL